MGRKTGKQAAAARREAAKRNETIAVTPPTDPPLTTDPNYVPPQNPESDAEAGPSADAQAVVPRKRKQNFDADLIPHRKLGKAKESRTTEWRNKNGITQKAKAANMQSSIASIFKPVVNPRKAALAECKESEEPDSDVEVLEPSSEKDVTMPTADGATSENNHVEITLDVLPAQLECTEGGADTPISNVATETLSPDAGSFDTTNPTIAAAVAGDSEMTPSILSEPSGVLAVDESVSRGTLKEAEVKGTHAKLRLLVKKHRKSFSKKETLVSNAKAAASILDLEALHQYNDKLLELSLKKIKLVASIKTANRLLRPRLKQKVSASHPSEEASLAVSHRCGKGPYYARILREMAAQLLRDGTLPEKHQGEGAHHESLLSNPAIREALQEWTKGTLEVEDGGFIGRMRPAKMRRYINDFLLPQLEINATISESTAVRWLKKMGFSLCRVQKGVYVDGHERKDVVESRNKFIEYLWLQILPFCHQYEEKTLEEIAPVLKDGEKIHYVIAHDECCVHAGDMANFEWMEEGKQPLRQKSRGRIVHVSDFILEHCGRLVLTAEEIQAQLALPKEPLPPSSLPSTSPPVIPNNPSSSTTDAPTVLIAAPPAKRSRKSKQAATVDSVPPLIFDPELFTETSQSVPAAPRRKGKGKAKQTAPKTPAQGRTYAENDWTPPPPPAPFSAYQIPSFDARRIIYPGAKHDPWWDMPQLIAQVKDAIKIFTAICGT